MKTWQDVEIARWQNIKMAIVTVAPAEQYSVTERSNLKRPY
jgi:hypothetical protein